MTHDDYIAWHEAWARHVSHWAVRGIMSRLDAERIYVLAKNKAEHFESQAKEFFELEPRAFKPEPSTPETPLI